jgi:4-amino-4-deoxy-L-arabinose transferase-like glycosyltransferase
MTLRTRLVLTALVALAIRVVYTLALGRDDNPESPFGDAFFFHSVANLIADGRGFSHPFYALLQGYDAPSAAHPPLWPLVLAAASELGLNGETGHRLIGNVIGTGSVVLTGLLGSRVGGERVGLTAAGVAAIYPVFIAADGSLMSESLAALLVLVVLLSAYRYLDSPRTLHAGLLGFAVGLAALSRSEALALVVVLGLPLVWMAGRRRDFAVVLCAALLVVAPWTIRNALAFDAFVPIATNYGSVIGGANCEQAYHGRYTGSWIPACAFGAASPPRDGREYDEAELARRWRDAGAAYATENMGRWPAVASVRVLRTWGLWQPRFQASANEGQNRGFARIAVLFFFPLALLGGLGAYVLRARRRDLLILLAPAVAVTLATIAGYGTYRLRHSAEPALVVLAAFAVVRLSAARSGQTPDTRTKGTRWRS